MAIVERQTTTTRTTNNNVEAESDAGAGILVVLAIIVALAAAYFAYDYYAAPNNDMTPAATTMDSVEPAPAPATSDTPRTVTVD